MKLGIVGLPNVGKTTLFNALTHAQAAATAYAFTSAESNLGVVAVPDPRLDRLDEVLETPRKVNATIDVVDIAGLAEGASRGEGLGNRFLADIRGVDAVAHVVRVFASGLRCTAVTPRPGAIWSSLRWQLEHWLGAVSSL